MNDSGSLYFGVGTYADDFSGLVDMENNLVYRVSGNAISSRWAEPVEYREK